jgi:type IV secretion system protein VirB5
MKKWSLILILVISCSQLSAILPVVDPGEILKTGAVLEKLRKQYTTLQNQYNTMQQQYQSMSGHYGWNNLDNSLSDLKNDKEWAPSSWQAALKGESGGNPDRYQQLLSQYKASHHSLNSSNYAKGSSKTLATSYNNQVKSNQASATQARYAFNNINQHLQTLYQLSQAMASSKNDGVKSAIDLNSRIELQIGYISVAELRMQALLNQQNASLQAAKIAQETEASEYNQAGE